MTAAIVREIELQSAYTVMGKFDTVYFGGGTPSLLEAGELETLLSAVHDTFGISAGAEITLEANPDDLSPEQSASYRSAGINRLSIGIQTFHNPTLNLMNRNHTGKQALEAIEHARSAGFRNISADLIFAVPGRSIDLLELDVHTLLAQRPEHISTYGLTIEPRTVFGKRHSSGDFEPVGEDQNADEFEMIMDTLEAAGYRQYEVSNFSLPGYASVHNSSYWNRVPYLGVGPGAHSFNGQERSHNIASNHLYMTAIAEGKIPCTKEPLDRTDLINEYLMTSLRLDTGCDFGFLKREFGHEPNSEQRSVIGLLLKNGSALMNQDRLLLTRKGRLIADQIAADLFLEKN